MKRILSCLLLLTLVVSLFACGKGNDPAVTTTGSGSEKADQTTSTEATSTEPEKPKNPVFEGDTVTLLVWSDVENPEFEITEQTGDLISDAIYERNKTVEDMLNVKLSFVASPGNFGNRQNFVAAAQNMIYSGTELDIMAAYSLTATTLVTNGLTYKLNELEYLDLSNPWWPQRLVDEATINGNIYFCSGDISTNMLHKMHSIFFDKDMCNTYGISADELYKTALDGKWTLDKLMETTANVYQDLNNDGNKDRSDKFGLYICDNYFDVFFYASELRTIDRDTNGTPVLSETFGSEKAINLASKVGNFFANSDGAFFITDFTEGRKMAQREAMMIITRCDIAYKVLRSVDGLDYGILPVPKYDEEQENYVSCLAFPCTLYTVSQSSKNPQIAGAVLEYLGQEGYNQVTPALFETTMKLKYASDDTTSTVYDIIRSSVSFDLGRMCASSFNDLTYTIFRKACSSNPDGYATSYRGNSVVMKKLLKQMLEKLS